MKNHRNVYQKSMGLWRKGMKKFWTITADMTNCLLIITFFASGQSALAAKKPVFGRVEYITILPEDVKIKAKMDTGAHMSSLHANDIKIYKKKNKEWVQFNLNHKVAAHDVIIDRPVAGFIRIKKRYVPGRGNEYSKRPYIKLSVCIGKKVKTLNVNLINRGHFVYPMILGKTAMEKYNILVDPSKKFTAEKECLKVESI